MAAWDRGSSPLQHNQQATSSIFWVLVTVCIFIIRSAELKGSPFLSSCSLPTQSFLLCPQPSWSCCVYTSWLGITCLAFPKSLSDNRSASSLRGAPSDSIHQTCFFGNFTPFTIPSTGESVGRGSEEAQGGRKEQREEWSRRRAGGRAHSL